MKFAGRLEREMFEAYEAALQRKIASSSWSDVESLTKIMNEVTEEHLRHFDLFFEPEFKDMSREQFLACMSKRH